MEAVISGFFAALGSAFGKIAFSSDSPLKVLAIFLGNKNVDSDFTIFLEYLFRGICIALMMSSNIFMMSLFVNALQKHHSTLTVTAISTSSNFVATGCMGILFFNEIVSIRWYCGALLCAFGSALISFSQTRFSRID